ncbi:LrgB family protein [Microvirga sp. W0021]|uniref:LrgB family protein n=1 Tax=Hohaiivirga grylli TaxID=3133970 RepID=A0ABV0BGE2_9HYPH
MNTPSFDLWVYLSKTPLLWLTATLIAYVIADYISIKSNRHALLHPVVFSTAALCAILALTNTPYETYFEGAQFVHFLLGPATVALGIPLYENRGILKRSLLPISAALVVGAIVATGATLIIAKMMGASKELMISLAPKSITTPVAMGISQTLGGDATLTATIVMITGITGVMIIGPLMSLCRIDDQRARGIAAGIACHGLGTAYSLSQSQVAGSFSGIGMGICSLLTTVLVPLFLKAMGVI